MRFSNAELPAYASDAGCLTAYFTTPFTYKFNEKGFRCDSFVQDTQSPLLFMGCSYTEGVGLPIESTWAYHIYTAMKQAKQTEFPFWSLAVGGASIDQQCILLAAYVEQLKPKQIIFLMPTLSRRLLNFDDKLVNFQPNITRILPPLVEPKLSILKNAMPLLTDIDYGVFESMKSLMLINSLARAHNFDVYYTHWDAIPKLELNKFNTKINDLDKFKKLNATWTSMDLARDMKHSGPLSNKAFADTVWNEVKDLI
jgi:hypothetical protein